MRLHIVDSIHVLQTEWLEAEILYAEVGYKQFFIYLNNMYCTTGHVSRFICMTHLIYSAFFFGFVMTCCIVEALFQSHLNKGV